MNLVMLLSPGQLTVGKFLNECVADQVFLRILFSLMLAFKDVS